MNITVLNVKYLAILKSFSPKGVRLKSSHFQFLTMIRLLIYLKNNPYKTDGSQLSNWHPTGIELLKHLSQNTTSDHFTPQALITP